MRQGLRFTTVGLLLLLIGTGCTEYRPVHQRHGESWAQARQLAYRDDLAKHPVSQTSGPRPFAIGPGQHLVMQGETLSELAVQYNVRQSDMAAVNRIGPPYTIYVGQILVLPSGPPPLVPRPESRPTVVAALDQGLANDAGESASVEAAEPARRPRPVVELEDPVYPTHTVSEGESLALIGERYGYSLGEMLSVNQHLDPAKLRAGQIVYIPDESRATYRSTSRRPMDQETVAKIRKASEIAPPSLSQAGFLMPVDGRIVGRFGDLSNGMRNDGINIAVPAGTPVKAAESGVVVFRGDNVGDFGRLLLIRHDNDFVTAYGHNSELTVDVGDRVARGQVIARSGNSGEVPEPQLHFQIRQGSTPIDPRTRLVNATGTGQG